MNILRSPGKVTYIVVRF